MKLLRQFLIILAISFVGEALKYLLPLPVPTSIYGMVILFVGLLTGLIKLSWVKDAGKFLIAVMPVMFIPAGYFCAGDGTHDILFPENGDRTFGTSVLRKMPDSAGASGGV